MKILNIFKLKKPKPNQTKTTLTSPFLGGRSKMRLQFPVAAVIFFVACLNFWLYDLQWVTSNPFMKKKIYFRGIVSEE